MKDPGESRQSQLLIVSKISDYYYTVNREIAVSLEQRNPRVVVQPALPGPPNPSIPNMTEH